MSDLFRQCCALDYIESPARATLQHRPNWTIPYLEEQGPQVQHLRQPKDRSSYVTSALALLKAYETRVETCIEQLIVDRIS